MISSIVIWGTVALFCVGLAMAVAHWWVMQP